MKSTPRLVLITGAPGIGKTTLCDQILKDWNPKELGKVIYMDKDVYMKQFYKKTEPQTPYHLIIQDEDKENYFLYNMFDKLIDYELSKGRTVFVDNPHIKDFMWNPGWRKLMNTIAKRTQSNLLFVKCSMPSLNAYKKRLADRNFKRDIKKLKDDESFREFQEREPMDFNPPEGSLIVDVSKDPEENSRPVIEYINKGGHVTL
jgi:predicted kinase